MRVFDLLHDIEPITTRASGGDAYARFAGDPNLLAIAVVDEARHPLGIITRAGFALRMADRFGRALYEKRSVTLLVENDPLLVDVDAPLAILSAAMLQQRTGSLLDGFIGVEQGVYRGVGTGIDVLRATAAEADRTAKRLAAERAKANAVEISVLALFRGADQLVMSKRAALARALGEEPPEAAPAAAPKQLADLIPHIDRLFEEISARDAALVAASEAAGAANHAKTQFLANTTHELRTPLNAIIGYSEMIEEEAAERGETVIAQDARRIGESGRHLLRLINAVLDMSRIEAGKMQLVTDEFELAAMIRESAASVRPQARAQNTTIIVECADVLAHARTDGLRLRQCVLNLLSNAVKFTREGTVTIRATLEMRDGRRCVRIAVTDTGIGMSEEEISRLFQPFTQASPQTTTIYGGAGLGLSITQRLIRMLGGDISVESEKGAGSTFTLVAPIFIEPGDHCDSDEWIVDEQKARYA